MVTAPPVQRTITKEEIESWGFQATQVYHALQQAATTGREQDAHWAGMLFDVYEGYLRSTLLQLVNGHSEIPRETDLDNVVLQYVLIRKIPDHLRRAAAQPKMKRDSAPQAETLTGLEEHLHAMVADPSTPYHAIAAQAAELIAAGKIQTVFSMVEYVREGDISQKL